MRESTGVSAGTREIVDLSQEIYTGMKVYAGHMKTVLWDTHVHDETAALFDGGFSYATKGLLMCDHGPTHVDAISHLDPSPGAPSIERMDLMQFQGPGVTLDVSSTGDHGWITGDTLEAAAAASDVRVEPDMVVLLHTGHHARHADAPTYVTAYPGLDDSGCEWLREQRVRVFGVDSPSPDSPASRTYPAHMLCRELGITHYENLANLDRLVGRPFTFHGFPLRLRGGTGSPVRAVAFLDGPAPVTGDGARPR